MLRFKRCLFVLFLLAQLMACGGGGGGGVSNGSPGLPSDPLTPSAGGDVGTGGAAASPGTGGTGSSVAVDAGATPGSGGTGADPGSGGTGDVASVGTVDGFGSVIVNGVTFDDTSAVVTLNDATALGLGMVIRMDGMLTSATAGQARTMETGVEVIGIVESVDNAAATLVVAGQTVQVDDRTVLEGVKDLAQMAAGDSVYVHGLPAANSLHATRLERRSVAATFNQVTGLVGSLNAGAGTFQVGTIRFDLRSSSFVGLTAADLVEGLAVKVRWSGQASSSLITADRIQRWLSPTGVNNGAGQLRGTICGFVGLSSFKVLGASVRADGAGVQFNVGSSQIGNGAEVVIKGHWKSGTLVAQQVTLITGVAGALPAYSLSGPMAAFNAGAHQFRIKGQLVSYDPLTVSLTGGTLANLANGQKLLVTGNRVSNGALQATSIAFMTP